MIKKLLLAVAAGVAAAALTKEQEQAKLTPIIDEVQAFNDLNTWIPPASAEPYLYRLNLAESKYGLPDNLLVRVAYQESRFRDDIVTGETVSGAGALGIMQIVPRYHPDIDPLNVSEAIDYAGRYLASLKRSTGSWPMALAAYNWGIGNLQRKGFSAAPEETRSYVANISGDVLGGYA